MKRRTILGGAAVLPVVLALPHRVQAAPTGQIRVTGMVRRFNIIDAQGDLLSSDGIDMTPKTKVIAFGFRKGVPVGTIERLRLVDNELHVDGLLDEKLLIAFYKETSKKLYWAIGCLARRQDPLFYRKYKNYCDQIHQLEVGVTDYPVDTHTQGVVRKQLWT